MHFREVVSLVYEGFELGILGECSFSTNKGGRVITFFYGGLESGSYATSIWFSADHEVESGYYHELAQELLHRVEGARQNNDNAIVLPQVKMADERAMLHALHDMVSRIDAALSNSPQHEV